MFTFLIPFAIALIQAAPPARPQNPSEAPAAAARQLAPLEPEGRHILHFSGPIIGEGDPARDYAKALDTAAPTGSSMWIDLPGARSWDKSIEHLQERLTESKATGMLLSLTVGFDSGRIDGFETAADADYAQTDKYDSMVGNLAKILASSGVQVFLRIGGELNEEWQGNHPYVFPLAFRKFVNQIRAAGAKNVATVWCIEPHGDPDLFGSDESGRAKWFPGDGFADWYGIDIFSADTFRIVGRGSNRGFKGARRRTNAYAVTQQFMAHAKAVGKPVFIAESTCYPYTIPSPDTDPDGVAAQQVWNEWFKPFTEWLDEHPEVKGYCYTPLDWSRTRQYSDWGDARIQINKTITDLWRVELTRERWINRGRKFQLGP